MLFALFRQFFVDFFEGLDFFFLSVAGHLCAESVALFFPFLVEFVAGRQEGGLGEGLAEAGLPCFGSLSFEFVFLFDDFSSDEFEINTSECVVGCDSRHDVI